MASIPEPGLDHIVILVPYETLHNLPAWLTDAFAISSGAQDGEGVTERKLIVFRDGIYIQLVAFVPGQEQRRPQHPWGARKEGHVIDWALTWDKVTDMDVARVRVAQANTGITYSSGYRSRTTCPDGDLQWETCAAILGNDGIDSGEPSLAIVGGEAPFWVVDTTPRDRRLPDRTGPNADHPCGALGVGYLSISVTDPALFHKLKILYDALQGAKGTAALLGVGFFWNLAKPDRAGWGHATNGVDARLSLSLAQVDEGGMRLGDVSVNLALYSNMPQERNIVGTLGDDEWPIVFKAY